MLYIKTSSGTSQLTLDKDYQSFKTSVESSLYFKPGDKINIRGVSCGWFTSGGKDLIFNVPVSKSVDRISKGELLSAKLLVRQAGKYAVGSSTVFETINLHTDNPRVNIFPGTSKGCLDIGFTFPTGRAITNNDTCGIDYILDIQFS